MVLSYKEATYEEAGMREKSIDDIIRRVSRTFKDG